VLRCDLTGEQVRAVTAQMRSRGYRPLSISAYNAGEANRFAVVYQKAAGPAWELEWGLAPGAFAKRDRELRAQGYALAALSGCDLLGAERLSALWVKAKGPDRRASHALEAAALLRESARMRGLGYRPVSISSYMVNAANVYAVIWEKADGVAWELKYGLSAQGLQDALDTLTGLGYRPTSVGGLNAGGVARYCAVWEKRKGPAWEVRFGQTNDGLVEQARLMDLRGLDPVSVAGFNTAEGPRFASLWQGAAARR
jgi:hypothetical protein